MPSPLLRRLPTVALAAVLLAATTSCSAPGDGGADVAGSTERAGAGATPEAGVVGPPAGAAFDYQLGGASEPDPEVEIVTRDRTDPAPEGRYGICYVNAFQTQPGEAAFDDDLLLVDDAGAPVLDPDWPDEQLLDLSTDDRRERVAEVVGAWFDGCAADGYRAVEPDNLDSWTRSRGLLTEADGVAYAQLLVERAHAAGLAIGQKNAAELAQRGATEIGFDFAVTEECQAYDECDVYTDAYGDAVIEVEYAEDPFVEACAARGDRVSVQLRDRDVLPPGVEGHVAERC
ncbi:endo alpha-1,4 polygalactosaminidase [Frigoribacterium salinisoli]